MNITSLLFAPAEAVDFLSLGMSVAVPGWGSVAVPGWGSVAVPRVKICHSAGVGSVTVPGVKICHSANAATIRSFFVFQSYSVSVMPL